MQVQGWTKAVVWLLCGSATLASCSKKKPNEPLTPLASATASSAPSAQATASATTERAPEPPKVTLAYRLGHRFDSAVTMFPLLKGVLACTDCDIGDKPNDDRHVFFFDGKTAKELPNLLSDKRISANLDESVTQLLKPFNGGKYTFSGTGPNQLELQVYGYLDDGSNGRQGYPHEERYLSFDGKSWQVGTADYAKNNDLCGGDRPCTGSGRLQRKYDDARLHGNAGTVVASDDGPLLSLVNPGYTEGLPYKAHVDIWDGKAWQPHTAPWSSISVVMRLVGGRTLVIADDDAYAIDAQGVPSPVAFEGEPAHGRELKVLLVAGVPWLLTSRSIYLPSEAGLRVSVVPEREPAPARPAAPTAATSANPVNSAAPVVSAGSAPLIVSASAAVAFSAAPSASVSPPSSATDAGVAATSATVSPVSVASTSNPAQPIAGIPAMTNFSAQCKTPFVVLFTPPRPNWSYSEAANNLVDAAPLQDSLWFVEFTRNKLTYFGAQAADETVARALIAAYVGKVPKAKPILGCLDMKAYLPDPYAPKWDAERILINLTSGLIL